jgi:uncharacterized protein
MRIVVAGGTGFLGAALVERLREEHDLVILTRNPAAARAVPGPPGRRESMVAWSPDRPAGAWMLAVQRADAVINLAGESLAEGRWTPAKKEAIRASRVQTTRALVEVARDAVRPPVFVSGSAIGFYGPRDEEPATEATPSGSGFLASVCRDWEREA